LIVGCSLVLLFCVACFGFFSGSCNPFSFFFGHYAFPFSPFGGLYLSTFLFTGKFIFFPKGKFLFQISKLAYQGPMLVVETERGTKPLVFWWEWGEI